MHLHGLTTSYSNCSFKFLTGIRVVLLTTREQLTAPTIVWSLANLDRWSSGPANYSLGRGSKCNPRLLCSLLPCVFPLLTSHFTFMSSSQQPLLRSASSHRRGFLGRVLRLSRSLGHVAAMAKKDRRPTREQLIDRWLAF